MTNVTVAGKHIAFAGRHHKLNELNVGPRIVRLGGAIDCTISGTTDFVVLGEKPGMRALEAFDNDVPVISGDELLSAIMAEERAIEDVDAVVVQDGKPTEPEVPIIRGGQGRTAGELIFWMLLMWFAASAAVVGFALCVGWLAQLVRKSPQ